MQKLEFEKSFFNIKKDSVGKYNFWFLVDPKNTKSNKDSWDINCNNFKITNSKLGYKDITNKKLSDITLAALNFEINNFIFRSDFVDLQLDGLSFIYSNEFQLSNLSTKVRSSERRILLSELNIATTNSQISDAKLEIALENDTLKNYKDTKINLDLKKSEISLADLASIIPNLKGMDQKAYLSGNISGTLENIKGKNILLATGNNTFIDCNFSLNDISEARNMYIFLDIRNTQLDFNDLSNIKLPAIAKTEKLVFPNQLFEAGLITYTGNFTGFLNDFVSYGKLQSKMGEINTDIAIIPNDAGTVTFKGELATSNFNAGSLFTNGHIGEISFNGDTYGLFNKVSGSLNGTFEGVISSFEINDYIYKNIVLDGGFFDKRFDGSVSIDDPNLRFDFQGELNLKPKVPQFDFNLFLYNANLKALNIDNYNTISDLSFLMRANFIGNSINNLEGSIKIENGNYRNQNGDLPLSGLSLQNSKAEDSDNLEFFSDFIDLTIKGDYNFRSLKNSIAKILHHEIPAFPAVEEEKSSINNFNYTLVAKDIGKISALFKPELTVTKPFTMEGKINSDIGIFNLSGNIPGINYKNMVFRDISFFAHSDETFISKIKLGEFHTESGLSLYNVAFNAETDANKTTSNLTWNNFHDHTYSGSINTITSFKKIHPEKLPEVTIDIIPSKIYIADSLWRIDRAKIVIDSTSLDFQNLKFHKKSQHISANGKISKNKSDKLLFSFNNIRLKQLDKYLQTESKIDGTLNGTIGVSDVYGQTFMSSNASVKDLIFREQMLGNLTVLNEWDNENAKVITILKVEKDKRQLLFVSGYYDPYNDTLSFNAEFDHLSMVILEKVIRYNFSNFHGDAIGQLKIHGKPGKILIDGALNAENAGLTINATQVSYHLSDSVIFSGDSIIFNTIELNDIANNSGIFDGYIVHDNFRNMEYNLTVSTAKILAMNTSPKDNEIFYGKVFAKGNLYIVGHGASVNIDGDATSLFGTDVNISLEYGEDAETYDFIQFVKHELFLEKEEEFFKHKQEASFNLNLAIQATPEAKVQIIYNSQIGDVIKAEGEGLMRFAMDKDGNIELFGDYKIDKGDYLFTLQNVINKKLSIGQGSSIVWNGDPYNAIIDINAVYNLKASLYELFVNSPEDIDDSQRIPVNCKILLTEDLVNPTINFDIEFPTADNRMVDKLQQFFNTEEEINRQILSLLVLGQFYTPEYMRGTYEANSANVLGTTASELFSNQLSKWLSQISNDWDIGLNYRPGTQLTNDEIELALSTQMFNDRVSINGNVGNNANPSDNNSSQLVGDFDLKVKLTDNGKLQLKAYNRSNNNLIYETAPYTQGIGVSIKEEFNSMKELLDKIVSLFRKRKNK